MYNKQYYLNVLEYRKQYRKDNRARLNSYNKELHAKAKQLIFEHYGNKCSCPKCPEVNPKFLTVDHINNDGYKLRKKQGRYALYRWIINNNFPDTIRLMCWNCNSGRYWNEGICPHLQGY